MLNSANNVMDILFEMKKHREKEIGLNEISRLTGINKSTVFKILNTLSTRNIVSQNPQTKRYYLSYGLLELSNKVLKDTNLYEVAHPIIKDLARITGKTVTLGIRYDNHLVFIDRIDGNESIHFHCEIGKRMTFYEGAAAKAFFAQLPNEELEILKQQINYEDQQANKVRIESFFSQIDDIKVSGWSTSDEEIDPGVLALGAPIFDYKGNAVAGIALASIKDSITDEGEEMLVNELLSHSTRLSKKLGYIELEKIIG